MEEKKKFVAKQPDRTPLIRGTTNINHQIRAQLRLNLYEYVVMDFLYGWYSRETRAPEASDWFIWLGVESVAHVFPTINILKQKGFLNEVAEPTQLWKNAFEGDFEELWKILTKGNKKTAKDRYRKVIKKITHQNLKEKLLAYVNACDESGTFKKGLEVWLNPSAEHWNDPLPESKFGVKKHVTSFEENLPPPIDFD